MCDMTGSAPAAGEFTILADGANTPPIERETVVADKPGVRRYDGRDAIVTWDASACVHSAVCLRTLPAAFDLGTKRRVRPDRADVDAPAAAIARCRA